MDQKPLKIIEIILAIAIVVGGGWWLFRKPNKTIQCGGIAAFSCPDWYYCKLQGPNNVADRAGVCKSIFWPF